jgi:hypothetical protein
MQSLMKNRSFVLEILHVDRKTVDGNMRFLQLIIANALKSK